MFFLSSFKKGGNQLVEPGIMNVWQINNNKKAYIKESVSSLLLRRFMFSFYDVCIPSTRRVCVCVGGAEATRRPTEAEERYSFEVGRGASSCVKSIKGDWKWRRGQDQLLPEQSGSHQGSIEPRNQAKKKEKNLLL